jgi:hypothetical protein
MSALAYASHLDEAATGLLTGAPPAGFAGAIGALVDGVIADPRRATTAVFHPLGCLYAELSRDPMRSLRLHVWGLDSRHFVSSGFALHAHDFDLHSVVLTGALEHRTYTKAAAAAGGVRYQVYEIDYLRDVNVLRPSGQFLSLRAEPEHAVTEGESYIVEAGRVHSVRAIAPGLTATFVAAVLRPDRRGLVLGPERGRADVRTVRRRCDAAELQSVLARVRDRMTVSLAVDAGTAHAAGGFR